MSKGLDVNIFFYVEFESLLLIVYYYVNRSVFQFYKFLEELVIKIVISLLRYIDIILVDKVFYEVGMMCRLIIYMCLQGVIKFIKF